MEKPSLITSLNDMVFLFSTFNEEQNPILGHNLELLKEMGAKTKVADGSGTRGQRFDGLMHGLTEELTVFVHPRTSLNAEAVTALLSLPAHCSWGAFTHSFDKHHPLLDFTSFWSNEIRGRFASIYYLDHVLYVKTSLAQKVGFPHGPIFEDTIFCERLKKYAKPFRLPVKVHTSSIRFEKNGYLKQSLLNQLMKLGYHLGVSPKVLNAWYEKGLHLNQKIT